MKEIYVVWKNPTGNEQYTEFKTRELAYSFMIEKLRGGCWACISDKIKVHKAGSTMSIARIIRS
jgi:hypothetical protein